MVNAAVYRAFTVFPAGFPPWQAPAMGQPAQAPPQEEQLPQEVFPAFLSRTMPRTMKKTDAATAAIRRMLT